MTQKANNNPAVKELIAQTETLRKVLDEIDNGGQIIEACRKHGMDLATMRHLLYNPLKAAQKNHDFKIEMLLCPEEILYCDIMEISKNAIQSIPDDLRSTIPQAMTAANLSARHQEIIFSKYWHDMTQEEIGKQMHMTHSRVNQLHLEAMTALRKPPIKQMLKHGAIYTATANLIRTNWHSKAQSENAADIEKVEQTAQKKYTETRLEALQAIRDEIDSKINELKLDQQPIKAVTELGLSRDLTNRLIQPYHIRNTKTLVLAYEYLQTCLTNSELHEIETRMAENGIQPLTKQEIQKLQELTPENTDYLHVYHLALPTRVINALTKAGIQYLYHLKQLTPAELENIRGMGETGIKAIQDELKKYP